MASSPLVSPLGERHSFLRLSYHLVRVAPHLFPASFIRALSAPCLRAARLLLGGSEFKPKKADPQHLAYRLKQDILLGGRVATEMDTTEEIQAILKDVVIRSCLLIFTELGKLTSNLVSSLAYHLVNIDSYSYQFTVLVYHCRLPLLTNIE